MLRQAHIVEYERNFDSSGAFRQRNTSRFTRVKRRQTVKVPYRKDKKKDSQKKPSDGAIIEEKTIDALTPAIFEQGIHRSSVMQRSESDIGRRDSVSSRKRMTGKDFVETVMSLKDLPAAEKQRIRSIPVDSNSAFPRHRNSFSIGNKTPDSSFRDDDHKGKAESAVLSWKVMRSLSALDTKKRRRSLSAEKANNQANDLFDIVNQDFWLKEPDDVNKYPVPVVFEVDKYFSVENDSQNTESGHIPSINTTPLDNVEQLTSERKRLVDPPSTSRVNLNEVNEEKSNKTSSKPTSSNSVSSSSDSESDGS